MSRTVNIPYPTTELQHQQAVFRWSQQPPIRAKWPELALLYHIPNERQCTPAYGRQMKLAGVRSGVPDLCLPAARDRYAGLYIEMKTAQGVTSDNQAWWHERLLSAGYYCEVCHGWESAVRVLEWYLGLPGKEGTK